MVKVIGHKDLVFLADCKAGAIGSRVQIASGGAIYCFFVPMTGQHPEFLKQWVLGKKTFAFTFEYSQFFAPILHSVDGKVFFQ